MEKSLDITAFSLSLLIGNICTGAISAAAMPASIFPVLNNLCQKHLRKLDARQRVYYDKQIMKLKGVLNENYPARMTLAQQGSFDLGYYHQTQKRYTKKEEKENV